MHASDDCRTYTFVNDSFMVVSMMHLLATPDDTAWLRWTRVVNTGLWESEDKQSKPEISSSKHESARGPEEVCLTRGGAIRYK